MGEACAYLYASRGDSVVVTSNEKERLDEVVAKCLSLGAAGALALPSTCRIPQESQISQGRLGRPSAAWT